MTGEEEEVGWPSFSPDGTKIVFFIGDVSWSSGDIYVMDLTKPIGREQLAEKLGANN